MSSAQLIDLGNGLAARFVPATGEKILWIHGYTLDSSIWYGIWQELADWSHLAVDLPNHGASAPFTKDHTLPALAQTLGQLAIHHEVRHVIGLSFGGMVALQVAMEYPAAFATLTLGSPGLGGGPQDPFARTRYMELMRLYWQKGAGPWMTELWMQWPPDIFKGAALHPELWQQLAEVINRHTWEELRNPAMQNISNYAQPLETLRSIQAATLVLLGEEDIPAFREIAALIQDHVPTCHCLSVPQAGHLSMLEQPGAAGAAIAAHLRAHSRPS